jgi:hypothetical protein
MKKDCLLEDLRNYLESAPNKSKNYNDHLLLGIEVSNSGLPLGVVTKLNGSPVISLGMIDLLLEKLQETRDEVMEQMKNFEKEARMADDIINGKDFKNFQKTFDKMSVDDKDFFNDIHKRILQALMTKNEEEMRNIMNEVKEYGKKKFGKDFDSDSDFNIDDFKNGF